MIAGKDRSRIERLIERHLPATFPALSICVIHRGDIILQGAWGWIDPETRDIAVTADSIFDLASVSKLVTHSSFLTLVEAGQISLENRLVDVVPEFGRVNPRAITAGQDPHTRRLLSVERQFRGRQVDPTAVTFQHLLTHTSGLPPWRSVYRMAAAHPPPQPVAGIDYDAERWRQGLRDMVDLPFAGTVGDTVRYTDIGIMLLGEAIARLQGCPLDEALRKLVLQPLQLSAFTHNPIANGIHRESIVPTEYDDHWRMRRAWGEVHDENACGVGGVAGHAGLFATAADLAQFGQAWLSGHRNLRISPALRQLATRQHVSGQYRLGLGWMLKAVQDSSAGDRYSAGSYGHTGFTGTSLWVDPQRQLVSAVLSNRVYHGRDPAGIHAFRRALHDLIVEAIDD